MCYLRRITHKLSEVHHSQTEWSPSLTNWVKSITHKLSEVYHSQTEWSPSLTNWVKSKGFMLSLWMIRRSLHSDKIHKTNNLFLIIPNFSSKSLFVSSIVRFRSWRKENRSKIPGHGIYRSVKLFLQSIKLPKFSKWPLGGTTVHTGSILQRT